MTDGYTGYQHLLARIAGIQQCCQHVIRRCRAVRASARAASSPGPGTSSPSSRRRTTPWRTPAPAATPPWTRRPSMTCGNATTRPRTRHHPQPAPRLGQREPPRIRARLLAAGLQGAGLPVHPRLPRGLDEQCQRARRQGRQAPPGRLRLLALPGHPRPLVPHPQLPRLRRRPRHHRTRRHPRRHRRKPLATATARSQLNKSRHPVNGHPERLPSPWRVIAS